MAKARTEWAVPSTACLINLLTGPATVRPLLNSGPSSACSHHEPQTSPESTSLGQSVDALLGHRTSLFYLYLLSLQGDRGLPGPRGPQGALGEPGKQVSRRTLEAFEAMSAPWLLLTTLLRAFQPSHLFPTLSMIPYSLPCPNPPSTSHPP